LVEKVWGNPENPARFSQSGFITTRAISLCHTCTRRTNTSSSFRALGGFEWEPEAQTDRERLAQIEAYKNLIQDQTRELETWTQHGDHAAKQGMTKQARFRHQMITGMEKKLKRYKEELRQLQSTPGSSWSGST